MEYRIFNKVVLYGAEQEEINKVFNFFGDEKKAIDFKKIIPTSTEPRITLAKSKHEEAWAYSIGSYSTIISPPLNVYLAVLCPKFVAANS